VVKLAAIGLVGAFALFYVLTSPDNAAHMAHQSWHFLAYLAHGVGHFVDKLAA
jgi:hypothetical protein